jgi:capsular exopolysaccharide synthesis family protein
MALALAQAGQSVVLVDADLRRPMVAEYLGLERSAGLTTVLIGDADLDSMLQPWGDDNFYVLSSGRIPPNPSELLGSQAMALLIRRLEDTFDVVVIDAPPLLPVTDAAVLAQSVGGVILMVDSQRTKQANVVKSLQSLDLVRANLLGVVLNRLPLKGPDAYGYGQYGYAAEPVPSARSRGGWRNSDRPPAKPSHVAPSDVSLRGVAGPNSSHLEDLLENGRRPATKFPGSRAAKN